MSFEEILSGITGGRINRLANWMYGPAGYGPGENVYTFGPEYTTGPFDVIPGWRPDIASQFDPDRAVGYFRFNTGNPERDALLSILANESGLDNYIRAVQAAERGDWFIDGPGAGAIGQLAMGAGELVGNVLGGTLAAGKGLFALGRGGRRLAGVGSRGIAGGRAALAAPPRPVAAGPASQAFAVGGAGAGSTVAQANVRNPYIGERVAQVARGAVNAMRAPKPAASAAAADAGLLRRAGRGIVNTAIGPAGARGSNILPTLGALNASQYVYGATLGDTRPTATQTARAQAGLPQVDKGGSSDSWLRNMDILDRELSRSYERDTMTTTLNTQTPDQPATEPPATESPAPANTVPAQRENVMAIQQQYNNLLRDLRSMFNTSETEEERERVRMMLADIEAQRDAGLEAISSGYAAAQAGIRERGVAARQSGVERGAAAGGRLAGVGADLESRLVDQQAASAVANRGLGVGAAEVDPMNEWVGLINTLAPLQQNYFTAMGDITGEGIDWMADTAGLQGQAQAADLQRLALSTATGAEIAERRRIADRIQRERELERQAMMQLGLAGLSAGQSASQFNASLALDEARLAAQSAEQAAALADEEKRTIWSMAYEYLYTPGQLESYIGRPLTPEEQAIARDARRRGLVDRTQGQT